MKVYIGPYQDWFGPYQLAAKILFWMDDEDDRVYAFGDWLSKNRKGDDSLLYRFLTWIDNRKKRKVKIRIDKYDTWNMDHTLALIILPMLKQLKETKHGSPMVDMEDVPENLRKVEKEEDEYNPEYVDEFPTVHDRWDWVMGEMIYAFEMELNEDWDLAIFQRGGDSWTDEKFAERKVIQDRISNGFRLFGKYYQALWD